MIFSKQPIVGIIGAGRLGTALARQALKAGYQVNIANSRGPQSLELITSVLLPGVAALTVSEVIKKSDLIVLAMPLNKYSSLNPAWLRQKTVIDAMNYWPPTEGIIPEFMNDQSTSSEHLQRYFADAYIIKTLNHVAYNELEEHSLPRGDIKRRAVALTGDNTDAKRRVEQFIDALGFDPIDLGDLREGNRFQPDTPLFNARLTRSDVMRKVH